MSHSFNAPSAVVHAVRSTGDFPPLLDSVASEMSALGYTARDVFGMRLAMEEALANADFIYVKNWSSYQPYGQVLSIDPGWMLTNQKLAHTNNGKVMHCLPVRRNVELSDEILDGPNSIVTRQASNRVWAAQAVIAGMLGV